MHFASFSGGLLTAIVVKPPERKLAKRISVRSVQLVKKERKRRELDSPAEIVDLFLRAPMSSVAAAPKHFPVRAGGIGIPGQGQNPLLLQLNKYQIDLYTLELSYQMMNVFVDF